MKIPTLSYILLFISAFIYCNSFITLAQTLPLPPVSELNRPFGNEDRKNFATPPKIYHPETWFHFIGGNVSKEGITTDLESIAEAGISGIQFFHGQFGGPWPGVEQQITCLSPNWEDAIRHMAQECKRLGLRFTMQNCPGWATSGGPWIEPSNAMRHMVLSRTDITGGTTIQEVLPVPQPSREDWRDYKDITVLAFPTPLDDTNEPLIPHAIESNITAEWNDYFSGTAKQPIRLSPTTENNPYWIEVTFAEEIPVRSLVFPSVDSFNHAQNYEPGVKVMLQAVLPDGSLKDILITDIPQANFQDHCPITLACPDIYGVKKYRISIINRHNMALSSLRLYSGARKNNWESEAGWTLRSIERNGAFPEQNKEAYIQRGQIVDLTSMMDKTGKLSWQSPEGNWTILRIGHVNTGRRNSPAPPEGTGWECNKFSPSGAEAQFAGYIGRLTGKDGVLANGLLDGMLLDSWECSTQTWTDNMEAEFERVTGYSLRNWIPALFGYVIQDHETTTRFLYDWRSTLNDLFTTNFYKRMSELAHENGLYITYETSAGDVFPADPLEYFKYADIPMCEFWQPMTTSFVGSSNYKPIKPAASATRLYGKPRLAAEAFTSFSLTWDEHLSMLKEVANVNSIDGVTHMVFHTYTHNPQQPFLPPGTAFGSGIGTPFLRGQTWWKYMPEFVTYLSRCSYLLERGKPVSDVLWYLGDEINHKPDQQAPFPEGFRYDYCNPDILLNRLSVKNGRLVTPEGLSYRLLWLPDAPAMSPHTLEKIYELANAGAIIIGNAPQRLVTLSGGADSQQRFDNAIKKIWGSKKNSGKRKVGRGFVYANIALNDALKEIKITPDVIGADVLWSHRQIDGADWYFICSPKGKTFSGTIDFRNSGNVEIWDPVTGTVKPAVTQCNGDRTLVELDLEQAGSCFVVFTHTPDYQAETTLSTEKKTISSIALSQPWTIRFPVGWGAPDSLKITNLVPWKEMNLSSEGKAFSGTATYSTTFSIREVNPEHTVTMDLGKVEMIATVFLNGRKLRTLWAPPYRLDITHELQPGENTISVEVTSTWFNRLVYDASLPEEDRKTWTINGPSKDSELRESGLLGPVMVYAEEYCIPTNGK